MKLSRNRAIDFRVNTLPTLFGEKIVLRILDPTSAQMGIDALGYEEEQKEMYLRALNQPQGMISSPAPPVRVKPFRCTPASIFSTSPSAIFPPPRIR
jgi:hypothetical protein